MINIVKTFFKSLYTYLSDPKYREFINLYQQYGRAKLKPLHSVSAAGFKLNVPDAQSFVWQYKELFVDEIYKFESIHQAPLIIDCGANIGLASLYFKQQFPNAKIIAIEADPHIAGFLETNLAHAGFSDIEIVKKAAWIHSDGIRFSQNGSDGGSITTSNESSILVPTTRLKDILSQHTLIDLLKMDIEGAETEVLFDCKEELKKVNKLFVEYHSYSSEPQQLAKLLTSLTDAGFRYYIQTISHTQHPLIVKTNEKMDLQLNIFANR